MAKLIGLTVLATALALWWTSAFQYAPRSLNGVHQPVW